MHKNNEKMKRLLEGSILRSLFTLAIPIVLANLLQAAYQLIDAFWVGRLGGTAVAAVSVSFPLMFLMLSLGAGLAIAGSTLIAQYFGAKNEKMVNHVSAQTLLMVLVVSVLLGTIGYIISPFILTLMGVSPDIHNAATGFLRVSFVGLIFTFGFIMFQSIMRGIGEVKMPMYIVGGTVLLNFLLDPLFIFGFGPIPALGVMGAAMATLGTQSIATILGMYFLLTGKYGIHLKIADFKPDFTYIKRAFSLGLPASIEQSARALGLTALTFIISSFGTLALASYGAGSNIMQFIFIIIMGISMAVSTLVGQNIGAGNIKRAAEIGKVSSLITMGLLTTIGLLVFIFPEALIRFFVPTDEAVIREGAGFLRIVALTFGFIGVQQSLAGIFRASGNMKTAMILSLVSQWVLQFPLAYILSKHTSLGFNGIWWSVAVTNIIIFVVTLLLYQKGDWKKTRLTKEEKLTEKVTEEIFTEEVSR